MAAHPDLNITVIYSEDGVVSPRVRRRAASKRSGARPLLGCLLLLSATAWLFATWFPIARFMRTEYMSVMMSYADLTQFFRPPPANLAHPAQPGGGGEDALIDLEGAGERGAYRSDREGTPGSEERRAEAATVLGRLGATKYTWLGVMTFAGCWLAMTGAAGVSGSLSGPNRAMPATLLALLALTAAGVITWMSWPRAGADIVFPPSLQYGYAACFALAAWGLCAGVSRRTAARLTIAGLLALAAGGYLIWRRYLGQFPIRADQVCVMFLMVVCALFGAALSSRRRGMTSVGVGVVLLSCAVTVGAIWYARSNGGFVTYTPTTLTYATAAAAQAVVAGLLLTTRLAAR